MLSLIRPGNLPLATRSILPGLIATRSLFGWLTKHNQKMIYPPSPSKISTKNRLFPTYIESSADLGNIVLTKNPLLLNFTIPGDKNCNKVTQALFDVLSDAKKYPLDNSKPVELASVACDSAGGRELMSTFLVNKIPSVVVLKKQMVSDTLKPSPTGNVVEEVTHFIKQIY